MSLKKRTKIEPRQNQTRQAPLGALPLGPAFSPDPGFTSEPRLLPDSGSMPIHPNKLPSHQPHLLPSSTKPHPSAFFVVLARGIASWLDFDGQLVGMFSFLTKCRQPPRTKAAHLNTLVFDEGRSTAEFKAPGDRFLVINRLPPATQTSSLAPPLHRHWYQEETFHVISGTAKFTLSRQTTTRIAKVGETVVIPKGEAHTFANASNTEELVIEFALDPPRVGRDETYFREWPTYQHKEGRTLSRTASRSGKIIDCSCR